MCFHATGIKAYNTLNINTFDSLNGQKVTVLYPSQKGSGL